MINQEKTIYALYHRHIYDTELSHYRNLQGFDPHKLAVKLLASLSLEAFLGDERVDKVDKDMLRYSILQWLFSLVIRDKKVMDIIRYDDIPNMPWAKHFEKYDEEKCEYIKIELGKDKDDNDVPNISFSMQIFNSNSVLFRQFILTLMADRYKNQPIEPIQLIYIFCSELCVLIDNLYHDGQTFDNLIAQYELLKKTTKRDR